MSETLQEAPAQTAGIDQTATQEYTSSRGVRAIFRPMPLRLQSRIRVALEKEWPRPEIPTYEAETFGGDVDELPHDETTVEGDPEAEAEWAEYQQELEDWEAEFNDRQFRALALSAMDLPDVDYEEWAERMTLIGLEVPESTHERKLEYVETEFIGSREDVTAVFTIPMRLSLEKSAGMEAVERMFRVALERWNTADGPGAGPESVEAGRSDGDGAVEEAADSPPLEQEAE